MIINKDKINVFTTIKSHGLKGFIKINIHVANDDFLELIKIKTIFLNSNQEKFEIESAMETSNGFNIKFKNFNKIEDIQNFLKKDFFINRNDLPIEMIPQDLINVNVFIEEEGKKILYGKIINYKFYKNINSMMIEVEETNKEILICDIEKFKNFNKEMNEIYLYL